MLLEAESQGLGLVGKVERGQITKSIKCHAKELEFYLIRGKGMHFRLWKTEIAIQLDQVVDWQCDLPVRCAGKPFHAKQFHQFYEGNRAENR